MNSKEKIFSWMLATSLSLINMTNGWIWITYATVSDFASEFYDVSLSQINWVSLLFGVIISVGGVPLIWFIERYGIKKTLFIAAILNLLCSIFRSISSASFLPHKARYGTLIFASVFGGISQPLGLFSSTKLAGTWFTPTTRANANTLASMGNPLGVLIASLLSPLIVSNREHLSTLNNIYLILPFVTLIFVIISVSLAPNKHNASLLESSLSFKKQLKLCLTSYRFIILNVAFGINIGVFTTYSTLIQQILCPFGYSDTFSGLCGSLFLGLGFPGVVVCSWITHKTNGLVKIVKSFTMLTAVGMIGFSIFSTYPNEHIFVAISVCWMGFFGFGAYPLCLELAAETAHPAGEVVTTGLLLLVSQVISMILILLGQTIAIPSPQLKSISSCSVDDIRNYWITNSSIASIGVINAAILMLVFNTTYRRTDSDRQNMLSDY